MAIGRCAGLFFQKVLLIALAVAGTKTILSGIHQLLEYGSIFYAFELAAGSVLMLAVFLMVDSISTQQGRKIVFWVVISLVCMPIGMAVFVLIAAVGALGTAVLVIYGLSLFARLAAVVAINAPAVLWKQHLSNRKENR